MLNRDHISWVPVSRYKANTSITRFVVRNSNNMYFMTTFLFNMVSFRSRGYYSQIWLCRGIEVRECTFQKERKDRTGLRSVFALSARKQNLEKGQQSNKDWEAVRLRKKIYTDEEKKELLQ